MAGLEYSCVTKCFQACDFFFFNHIFIDASVSHSARNHIRNSDILNYSKALVKLHQLWGSDIMIKS